MPESPDAGFAAIAELPDRQRAAVDERVNALYEEIRHTLRVPFVNFLFRVTANYPDELERLWRGVRPVAASLSFERAADELRAMAVLADAPGSPLLETSDGVRAITETIHYVLPKLLLIATSWRSGPPSRAALARAHDPLIPREIAHGTASAPLVDPKEATGVLAELFEDIRAVHAHPAIASYYRALANWPETLAQLWQLVRPHIGEPSYARRRDELSAAAQRRAEGLGLLGGQSPREPLPAVFSYFQTRLVPELLLDVALIRAAIDGAEAARRSPHSVRS